MRTRPYKETQNFVKWREGLRDQSALGRVMKRIVRLCCGNAGDHRFLGDGVSEMRIDYGPGYRVYYTEKLREIVILLVGGDKRTQKADIKLAKELAAMIQEDET